MWDVDFNWYESRGAVYPANADRLSVSVQKLESVDGLGSIGTACTLLHTLAKSKRV